MEHYDIFISYRREGSEYLPMHMKYLLEQRGYRAFFDMESMRSGMFNEQIYTVIEQCSDMVLILPPNALDRCINEGDWLRLEITHALKCKKNIIPVMMRGFAGFPENLPAEISQVRYCQGVTASSEYFDSVMDRICRYLHAPKPCLICPHCGQPTPANFAAKTELCERCGEAFVVAKAAPAMQVGQAAPQPVVLPQRVPNAQPVAASDPADFCILEGKLVKYKGSGGAVVIPDGVNVIQHSAFFRCSSLASITISDRVSEIETGAFADCDSLTKITVSPNNSKFCVVDGILYTKDRRRLICCPGGRQGEVVIPDGVTSIDESAFLGCKSLTSITIPNSVTSIGEWAFGECKALNTISVSPYNTAYCDIDGVLYTKDRIKLICCPGGRQGEFVIPNGVTCIGNQAFAFCVSLTGITIPDSVTSIGEWAFSFCKSLTGIRIPDHVLSIESYAFRYCRSLTFINIPNSVTSIGSAAFFECKSLTDVTIPDSVTRIGPQAFQACTSLESVTILGNATIDLEAFADCTALREVSIARGAKYSRDAFRNTPYQKQHPFA